MILSKTILMTSAIFHLVHFRVPSKVRASYRRMLTQEQNNGGMALWRDVVTMTTCEFSGPMYLLSQWRS
jgi:hypothetical protein